MLAFVLFGEAFGHDDWVGIIAYAVFEAVELALETLLLASGQIEHELNLSQKGNPDSRLGFFQSWDLLSSMNALISHLNGKGGEAIRLQGV